MVFRICARLFQPLFCANWFPVKGRKTLGHAADIKNEWLFSLARTDDRAAGKLREGNDHRHRRRPWTSPLSSSAHLVVGGGGVEVHTARQLIVVSRREIGALTASSRSARRGSVRCVSRSIGHPEDRLRACNASAIDRSWTASGECPNECSVTDTVVTMRR